MGRDDAGFSSDWPGLGISRGMRRDTWCTCLGLRESAAGRADLESVPAWQDPQLEPGVSDCAGMDL